ncbi:ABC transporter substrate-binding protein [Amycolatopsis sp.]|uniref:ABC transporter substrate-binding protein n=1 Tax=Amycolatopsis sp. TaxID=37632 RepID=UPI002CA08A26|nr:ABC transporter substrate-binding protein [Amycolatopsis sp.]HVV12697.1 ABC transporter substrate-binding protein [Amycolatopsis sp.]
MRISGKRRPLALAAVTVIAAAGMAGCGGGDTGSAQGSGGSADLSVLGPANKATGAPVKIGLFNVEGGSTVSQPFIGDAAEAAAKYANDHLGGLNGHVIEIERCGDKADGASAAACANKFVQDKVTAVVAGQPATADQIVPVLQGAGIPWVGSSPAAASEITGTGTYFFGSGFIGLLGAWAQYSKDQHYQKFTIYGPDNPQLVAAVQAIGAPLFKKVGVDMQLVTVPQGVADSSSQVQAGLTRKPDAVGVVADNTVCQSVLSALQTSGTTVPKLVNTSCVAKSVIDALGDDGINGVTLFDVGDPVGSTPEAKLYQAVMAQYAPSAEATGITPIGYLSMLGFIRAVNAGAGSADITTPAGVKTAIGNAKNVPLPIGDGATFSCDKSVLPAQLVKATICSGQMMITKYSGSQPGPYSSVDVSKVFG